MAFLIIEFISWIVLLLWIFNYKIWNFCYDLIWIASVITNLIVYQYCLCTLIPDIWERVLFENLQLKGRRCNHTTTRTCSMRICDCKYWFLLLYSPDFFKWQGNKSIFLLHTLQDQCHLSAGNYFKCNIKNVWFFFYFLISMREQAGIKRSL